MKEFGGYSMLLASKEVHVSTHAAYPCGQIPPRNEQQLQLSSGASLSLFCSRVTSFTKAILTYYLKIIPAILFLLVGLGPK